MTWLKLDLNPQPRKGILDHFPKLSKWLSCIVNTYLCGALVVRFYHIAYSFRLNLHSVSAQMPRTSSSK